jgi:uroporphyrinogen decarboxylase
MHATLWPGIAERLYRRLHVEEKVSVMDQRTRSVRISEEVLSAFDIDTRWVYIKPSSDYNRRVRKDGIGLSVTDEWGMEFVIRDGESHPDYRRFPLHDADSSSDIEKHEWPDPNDASRVEGLLHEAKSYHDLGYAVGINFGGVWERSWYVRGMDRIMMDLAVDPSFARSIFQKIFDVQSQMYELILKEVGDYLSIVCLSSDMGTQSSLLVSPEIWRKYICPFEHSHINLIKKNTEAIVAHHACGAVRPLIPDYIEMGIEVLNPVQTTADGMDPFELKREFGNDISFWGGIDTQKILPFGSTKEVKEHVRKMIDAFSPGGGYLFATCQNIQDEVPVENIVAMYETLDLYG